MCRKVTGFHILLLCAIHLLRVFFIRSKIFWVEYLNYKITSPANEDNLTSSFPVIITFISFSCLIAVGKTSFPCLIRVKRAP